MPFSIKDQLTVNLGNKRALKTALQRVIDEHEPDSGGELLSILLREAGYLASGKKSPEKPSLEKVLTEYFPLKSMKWM